jgi:hypothetical protein
MPKARVASKTRRRARSGLAISASSALRSARFGRAHIWSRLTTRRNELSGDVGRPDPVIFPRSVHGNYFLVIFAEIDLVGFELALASRACQSQQRARVFAQRQPVSTIVQDDFAHEDFSVFLEKGGAFWLTLFVWLINFEPFSAIARLLHHGPSKFTAGQKQQSK